MMITDTDTPTFLPTDTEIQLLLHSFDVVKRILLTFNVNPARGELGNGS